MYWPKLNLFVMRAIYIFRLSNWNTHVKIYWDLIYHVASWCKTWFNERKWILIYSFIWSIYLSFWPYSWFSIYCKLFARKSIQKCFNHSPSCLKYESLSMRARFWSTSQQYLLMAKIEHFSFLVLWFYVELTINNRAPETKTLKWGI